MIKGKYKQLDLIKENNYKSIYRCAKDGLSYFVKAYAVEENRLIQN